MTSFSNVDNDLKRIDEKIGQAFYTNGRYNAVFLVAAGLGFVVIYILTLFSILGEPSPQLLYISGAIFFLAVLQFPIMNLAQHKRGIVARSRRYRSLRTQLVTSFVIIVTIPTLMATVLSAIGAYVNNESQVLNVLETVSKLKKNQINEVINGFKIDAARISRNGDFSRNVLKILIPGASNQATLDLFQSFARNQLLDFQNTGAKTYSELMVLNIKGDVVVSTDSITEGKSFQSELFYREGSIGDFTGFSKNPLFGSANLIFSTPIYDVDGKVIRGILVLRANSNLIVY